MKYVLICAVILSGALLGNTFTMMEKKRLACLNSLMAAARTVESHMVKRGCTLSRALVQVNGECEGLFHACACELAEHPDISGAAAAEAAVKSTEFNEADAGKAFAEYIEGLSAACICGQIESCTLIFLEKLQEMQKDTRDIRMKKAGTIKNLCIFSAIALGIILI